MIHNINLYRFIAAHDLLNDKHNINFLNDNQNHFDKCIQVLTMKKKKDKIAVRIKLLLLMISLMDARV